MSRRAVLIGGLLVSSIAGANPLTDDDIYVVEPGRTADRAQFKPGRIAWCAPGPWKGEVWDYGRLRRATHSAIHTLERAPKGTRLGSGPTLEALEHLCQWPDDKGWQKQVMYLYQAVMNSQDVTQDEAVELVKTWIGQGQAARDKESRPPTDEERFAFSEHSLTPVKPEYGIDTAKITGAIPWCDKAAGVNKDRWEPGRIARTIDAPYGISGTIEGAYHLCQRPNDTTWKQKATYTLQKWMNWTGQPQSEAVQSIRARIQAEKMKTEKAALCKALEIGAEVGGQAKAYADARQRFFGCAGNDGQELWRDPRIPMDDQVGFWLDADSDLDSELVRMYWLFGQTEQPDREKLGGNSAFDNRPLLQYAVASIDFGKLDWKAIEKELAGAPYRGSEFARAVASESFHLLRWRRKLYEEAIDKLAKQASEYNAILREAPKQGFAQWDKVTAPWKAELARSLAFEKKLSSPSRKALQGCSNELMPDVQKLIKSYKKPEYAELVKALANDPIASLLLSRLAVCFAAEKVVGSGAFRDIVQQGRAFRGPRTMAYYAVIDALTEALEDRPKLLLGHSNFVYRSQGLTDVYRNDFSYSGAAPRNPKETGTKGIVKEVKKGSDGLTVVFKTQKLKYPEYDCVPTNRPIRIRSDGGIDYEHNCRATGRMLSQDVTPAPITISPLLATGVKPGAYVVAHGNVVVYVAKKAEDKKILTFFGFTP